MEYNDFKREERSRNIKGSALKSICSFQESVTYIHESLPSSRSVNYHMSHCLKQASAHEACDGTCMTLHMPTTLKTCINKCRLFD